MKKLLLTLFFLSFTAYAKAGLPEWNYVPRSSYTEVATGGVIQLTSATIRLYGVTISSPALGSYLAFWRSTSSVMTNDITTQALITTDYSPISNQPTFINLFDVLNTSYTYFNKVGTAKVIMWFRCMTGNDGLGFCPGLKDNGQP